MMKRIASLFLVCTIVLAGCNGCNSGDGSQVSKAKSYDAAFELKKRIDEARAKGEDITVMLNNGVNLRMEKDILLDAKTNQPYTGAVNGDLANAANEQTVIGKMVNGKWDGNYEVRFHEGGRSYVGVKRTYKEGKQVGSSYAYYPNGRVQAEFKFNDQGMMICATNFDENGTKTVDSCGQKAQNTETKPAK